MRKPALAISATILALGIAGCGDSQNNASEPGKPSSPKLAAQLKAAQNPNPNLFPKPKGRNIQELADQTVRSGGQQVGLAGSVFTTGLNRLAFGVISQKGEFLYGPTAVYIAKGSAEARGPYMAPADLLITKPAFRSKQANTDPHGQFAAIYAARVPIPSKGVWNMLVLTQEQGKLIGAANQIKVEPKDKDKVVKVGDKAPSVDTDTLASVGSKKLLDTREPASDMHDKSLKEVLGKKPVVLLFATPQFCSSRVCGPVTDIVYQLKQKYGDRAEFIHQEVYKNNQPSQGVRPPLKAFGLQTEPWLFTIDRNGKVVERLEGSFGFNEIEAAIQKAIQD